MPVPVPHPRGLISAFKTVLGRGASRSTTQLLPRMQENLWNQWQFGKVVDRQSDNPVAKSRKVVKKADILRPISVETVAISKDLFDSFEHLDCPLHYMTKVLSKSPLEVQTTKIKVRRKAPQGSGGT